MDVRVVWLVAVLACGAARAQEEGPARPVRIRVAASPGEILPQSRGGGGFQRTFRFTAAGGEHNHWIRQELAVRGTVFDDEGGESPAHLDVVEYYRVDGDGRALQADSHYSQFPDFRGGDLAIRATLTYGRLEPRRRGDRILAKSFILRAARDAEGELVPMRTQRTRRLIDAERGRRVTFRADDEALASEYEYRVRWDARTGVGSRTQPSGAMDRGTWRIVPPAQDGPTRASSPRRPIPELEPRR